MNTTDNIETLGTVLKDDELEIISGGEYYKNESRRNKSDVTFIKNVGDIVEVGSGWGFGTVRCKIVERRIGTFIDPIEGLKSCGIKYYYDEYKVEPLEPHWYFYHEWVSRCDIEK